MAQQCVLKISRGYRNHSRSDSTSSARQGGRNTDRDSKNGDNFEKDTGDKSLSSSKAPVLSARSFHLSLKTCSSIFLSAWGAVRQEWRSEDAIFVVMSFHYLLILIDGSLPGV